MNILYITDYNFASDRLQISSFDMVYKGEAAAYNIYNEKLYRPAVLLRLVFEELYESVMSPEELFLLQSHDTEMTEEGP